MRQYNLIDRAIFLSEAVFLNIKKKQQVLRKSPGQHITNKYELNDKERTHIAGLMRVNHSGEVCAQALYQGQALTAKLDTVREKMQNASEEEIDHLHWCEERIKELDGYTSYLNPLWFLGSFIIGGVAGILGDTWSLGFVAETERQVGAHLKKHIAKLPAKDLKTRAILEQMYEDETKHAHDAISAGGKELPYLVKEIMGLVAKIMTTSSYYI